MAAGMNAVERTTHRPTCEDLLRRYQLPPHVVCIRFSKSGGCISDSRSREPVRSHQRTRSANSFTSERVLPTAVKPL